MGRGVFLRSPSHQPRIRAVFTARVGNGKKYRMCDTAPLHKGTSPQEHSGIARVVTNNITQFYLPDTHFPTADGWTAG